MLDLRVLDFQPTGAHDASFKNKELKCTGFGSKYLRNVGRLCRGVNLGL
jgi:hypothetical protein